MKVPLEWLKEYVTVRLAPQALAARLTMAGLEVVAILDSDGQPVFDIEVTPNRADCLSIIGVAREVAMATGQRLKLPLARGSRLKAQGKNPPASSLQPPAKLAIRIEDRKGCPRYLGRLISGVRVGPSPDWMQRRLLACGVRPINNVVDITNYVLFERGQPLHAFDFARLAGGPLAVRAARADERITTLDGARRTLSPEVLVIADGAQAVAVAGVMGGIGSEVTLATTTLLLESALFDPIRIRRAARALGLASESSYRFERGVDPLGVEPASARAAALLTELAGGQETARRDVGATPRARPTIVLEPSRASRWLGVSLDASTIRTTLARLSCRVASAGAQATLRVTPPTFRQDLRQAVDLYEELARAAGYDRLPVSQPAFPAPRSAAAPSEAYWRTQSLKCLCASLGLHEAVTWSLLSEAELARFGSPAGAAVRLVNPLSQDHAILRPSLLTGLLQAVRRNLTQGASGVRLFEVGSVFEQGREPLHLGIMLSGCWTRDWRATEACDFFRLKGVLEAVAQRLCAGVLQLRHTSRPWAEPNQAAEVTLDGRVLGVAGQLARRLLQEVDVEQDVWFAELSVEALTGAKRSLVSIRPPAVMPPVKRDLSLFIPDGTAFEAVDRAIRGVAGALASRVELIDRYTGAPVPAGKSSLTFSIEYRDASRTLTATEVDALHQRIGQMLTAQLNAQLR